MVSTPPIETPPTLAPSPMLAAKLKALRRKHVSTAVLTGVALAVAVCVEVLALAMFFDWLVEFPWAFRLVLLLAQAAVFGYIAWRFILLPIVDQPTDDELALLVERARPSLRSRLIASIQLTRPGALGFGASNALANAAIKETETLSYPMDFPSFVPTEKLKKLGFLALFVSAIAVFALVYGQATTIDLLKRAFLSHTPVPRKTRVLVQDGDKIIGRGDSVRLVAYAQGIIPGGGKLEVRYRGRRAQDYSLEPDKQNKAVFVRTIENVQESFTYVACLNDGRSETFQVKAIPRPTVAAVQCDQEFPAYTKREPVRRALGDLTLLAGSVLKLKVAATKEIKEASVKLVGLETNTPLQVTAANAKDLTGQFNVPVKGLTGFSINLRDTEGMDSTDSAIYRVDVVPDKPPVVRLTYPDRKEELITRYATLLVGIEANDDFDIARLRIRYKVHLVSPALELTNFPSFAGKLNRAGEPVSQFVWEKLSLAMRQSITAARGKTNQAELLQSNLADELNAMARSAALYDKDRFSNIVVCAEARELIAENPQGENLARLNRLLLRDAYPGELSIEDGVNRSVELDLDSPRILPIKRRYEWKIGDFNPLLTEGTKLEFWLEAEDNNNVTGPGIGTSEHQFAKIVSEAEKRSDLLNRAGDYLGSISDVAGDQEKLNRNLGLIIREKSTPK